MKAIQQVFTKIMLVLPYLIVFIFSLYVPSDPDLGWHLKYGQYFWQHGRLLRDNTFSTMMPQYHWANTSWLTDIISFTSLNLGGFLGLTLLSAFVVVLTFYFFAKAAKMTLWEQTIVFPVILYLEKPINEISFRGQQVVLLFIGILFYFISLYEKNSKILWLVVPLFWIWVNIDGEFLLGYALFISWIGFFIIKKLSERIFVIGQKNSNAPKWFGFTFKKLKNAFVEEKNEIGFLLLIAVLSLLATLINPYGYGLYLDAFSHIGNPLLKDIGEYLPFDMYSQGWWNQVLVGIALIFGLFVLTFRGKFMETFPFLGGGLLLYLLSLQVLRYAWPAYYLLFPLLAMVATFLKPDGKKITQQASVVLLFIFLGFAIWARQPFTQFVQYNWNDYCHEQILTCSSKSAEFMITHGYNHNIFSLYGWGGWLIWNYPQIKPTIDGRMHLWAQNGYSAFTDYYLVEQSLYDIDLTNYDVAYMSPGKPVYKHLVQLSNEGKWELVYQDKYAGIFVRRDR